MFLKFFFNKVIREGLSKLFYSSFGPEIYDDFYFLCFGLSWFIDFSFFIYSSIVASSIILLSISEAGDPSLELSFLVCALFVFLFFYLIFLIILIKFICFYNLAFSKVGASEHKSESSPWKLFFDISKIRFSNGGILEIIIKSRTPYRFTGCISFRGISLFLCMNLIL